MARRRKKKLSRSLLARLTAISVLVGMGGLAIVQSQMGASDPDKVAEGDAKKKGSPNGDGKSESGENPKPDSEKPSGDKEDKSPQIRVVSHSDESAGNANRLGGERSALPRSKPAGGLPASAGRLSNPSGQTANSGLPGSGSGGLPGSAGAPPNRLGALQSPPGNTGRNAPRLGETPGRLGSTGSGPGGLRAPPSRPGAALTSSETSSSPRSNGLSLPASASSSELSARSSNGGGSNGPLAKETSTAISRPQSGINDLRGSNPASAAPTSQNLADADDSPSTPSRTSLTNGAPARLPSSAQSPNALSRSGLPSRPSTSLPNSASLPGSGRPTSGSLSSSSEAGTGGAGASAGAGGTALPSSATGLNPTNRSNAGSRSLAGTEGASSTSPNNSNRPGGFRPASSSGRSGSPTTPQLGASDTASRGPSTGNLVSNPALQQQGGGQQSGGQSSAPALGSIPRTGGSLADRGNSSSSVGIPESRSTGGLRETPDRMGVRSPSTGSPNSGLPASNASLSGGPTGRSDNPSSRTAIPNGRTSNPAAGSNGGSTAVRSGSSLPSQASGASGLTSRQIQTSPTAQGTSGVPATRNGINAATVGLQGANGVSETPGGKDLEGAQTPSVVIEKRAPREVQVGRVATFETMVRNVGQGNAVDVIVTDRIPAGTRLESLEPKPISNSGGLVVWNLGELKPGQSKVISMNVTPLEKGEIGSVAQLTFNARAGVRTICTKPDLDIQVQAPERVMIGQNVGVQIQVRNLGDGVASGVIIEEDVPNGLSHPEGRELQYHVGTLGPGESRQLVLTLRAETAARVKNLVSVRGDNNLSDEASVNLEVVAPKLAINMDGPKRRYLERKAIHTITIENSGTAPASNVEIVAYLPKGLKFEETNNHGNYDPNRHAVFWGLEQLPAGAKDSSIQLVTLPVDTGEQSIEYRASADLNLASSNRLPVIVEQLAELYFDIDDVADPIEVDSDTMYELRVTNQGSKVATQIELQVAFPTGIEPVKADGPTGSSRVGQRIVFDRIAKLAPGETLLYRIQARGQQAGDHRIEVQMVSAETPQPVKKQASTRVYSDLR